MHINPKDLEEFKQLYKSEFGTELSHEEVSEIADRLVSLYVLLSEPLPSEEAIRRQGPGEGRPSLPSPL